MKTVFFLFFFFISLIGFSQRLECETVGSQIGYYDTNGEKKLTAMVYSVNTIILTNDCMVILGAVDKHFEIGVQVKHIVTQNWILEGWESKDQEGRKCVIEVLYFKNNQQTNIIIDYGNISWIYKIGGCK